MLTSSYKLTIDENIKSIPAFVDLFYHRAGEYILNPAATLTIFQCFKVNIMKQFASEVEEQSIWLASLKWNLYVLLK